MAQSARIGITAGMSGNELIRFVSLDGGAGYSGEGAWQTGIAYQRPLSATIDFSTGLSFYSHTIKITPEFFPDIEQHSRLAKITLIEIPFHIKINTCKYFSFEAGPSLVSTVSSDMDNFDDQSGLAWKLGFGLQLPFKKLVFALNPFIGIYSLPPFNFEHYHQHLIESGVQAGIYYNLKH